MSTQSGKSYLSTHFELDAASALAIGGAIQRFKAYRQDIYHFYVMVDKNEDGELRITISAKSRRNAKVLVAASTDNLRSYSYIANEKAGSIEREVGVR